MKKIYLTLFASILFLTIIFIPTANEIAQAKTMWGKVELKTNMIGKVTIVKDIYQYSISKKKLKKGSKLKKGKEYGVFSYSKSYGGIYKIGSNKYIKKNSSIKYYKVPKDLIKDLNDGNLFTDSRDIDKNTNINIKEIRRSNKGDNFILLEFNESIRSSDNMEFKLIKENTSEMYGIKSATFYPDKNIVELEFYEPLDFSDDYNVYVNIADQHSSYILSADSIVGNINTGNNVEKGITNGAELQDYLRKNYSELQTNLTKVYFDISVSENDSINLGYDFEINLGMDSFGFEQIMNGHLRSIKNASTAKEDVQLARKQLNEFLEKMAKDIIEKMPNKKFLGQNTQISYRYPALKMDKLTVINYSWTNYEPISMKNIWPGDQPDDYFDVISDAKNYDSEKAKKYREDDWKRRLFKGEYVFLIYNDFRISDFSWKSYLDDISSSTW